MEHLPLTPRRTGRPLSFDRDRALKQAMLAFWQHGYETTSVSDLTRVMGITAPSLYTAFGDKKHLFLEAMHLYAGPIEVLQHRLDAAPSARDAAAEMLRTSVLAFTGSDTPKGCLLASAAATGSAEAADVRQQVTAVRQSIQDRLADRIGRDIAAGLLPPQAVPASLAAMIVGMIQGMSVLARDGMERGALLDLADTVMLAWPVGPDPG